MIRVLEFEGGIIIVSTGQLRRTSLRVEELKELEHA